MSNVDHIFNTPRQATFNPSVATQVFALPYPIYAASNQSELNSDELVTVAGVVATGYTISGTFVDGVALDGSLSLAAPVSGVTVQIWSRRQPRTSQDLATGGTVTPSELQAMFNAVIASQRDIYDWLANLQSGSPFIPVGTYLPTAGGTMIGGLVLAADPDANLKAATKQYVDNKFGGAQTWAGLQTYNAGLLLATGLATFNGSGALFNGAVAYKENPLTDHANIAWDMSLGPNAGVTIAGNRTLTAPTNRKLGQSGKLRITQDATGGRSLALDTVFSGFIPLRTAPNSTITVDYTDTVGPGGGAGSIVLNQPLSSFGPHVIIEDQKASGTVGQAPSAGVDTQLILNTLVYNAGTLATLASNQFTLPAGTYYINFSGNVGTNTNTARSFLYNITDAAVAIVGTGANGNTAGTWIVQMKSSGAGVITIATTKTFEMRVRSSSGGAIGGAMSDGRVEVYSHVEITKVA